MEVPKQASWVIKKIFTMRKVWPSIQSWDRVESHGKISVKKSYAAIKGVADKVNWRSIISKNAEAPTVLFIAWIVLQAKLRTKDVVARWNSTIDQKCSLCESQGETRDHLLFECNYSSEIWKNILVWIGDQT